MIDYLARLSIVFEALEHNFGRNQNKLCYISASAMQKSMQAIEYYAEQAHKVMKLIDHSNQVEKSDQLNEKQYQFWKTLQGQSKYTTQEFIQVGQHLEISERTAHNWHKKLIRLNFVQKYGHGKYCCVV